MSNEDPKDGGPAIALKGAKAANTHRGIRNPLSVAEVSRPAASLHAVSKPAHSLGAKSQAASHVGSSGHTGGGEALPSGQPLSSQQALSGPSESRRGPLPLAGLGKVEYSKISGLSDNSHHLTNGHPTRLSVDLFHGSTHRFGSIGRGVVVFFVVSGLAAVAAVPKLRNRVLHTVIKAKTELVTFARHRKPLPKHSSVAELEASDEPAAASAAHTAGSEAQGPALFTTQSCTVLMRDVLGARATTPLRTRVQAADCYLIKDDPANAEKALVDVASKVHVRGGSRADDPDLGGLGEAMLTLQSALLKQGNDSAANQLVASGCIEWRQTTPCVAKLMVAAARRPPAPLTGDSSKMFSSRGLLPPKSEARLWLAGAQLAAANGGGDKTVAQRFKYALEVAPKDAVALRKDAYEARVMDQWQRGDPAGIRATIKAAQRDLSSVAPADLVKLKLIGELADAGSDAHRLHALLTREDILFRARGDLDLLDILGPEALRAGLIKDYLQLLHRTRDYYATRYHAGAGTNKRLVIWEVRGALASGDADGAIGILANYSRSFGNDALSHHLRGAAYTSLTSSLPYQRLAAQEFQAAVRLKLDWESLYGLGIALIRARRAAQIPSLLADLTKMTRTTSQRYWLDMLRAELVISETNYAEALRILTPYSRAQPVWVTARTLLLQVYQKTGKTQLAEALQGELKVLSGRLPFATSAEGFASPLGCMALAKRPLE